jgi:hypothetical protein
VKSSVVCMSRFLIRTGRIASGQVPSRDDRLPQSGPQLGVG